MVDPEPLAADAPEGNVLVSRSDGGALLLSPWESERTVIDQGCTVRRRLHRCETAGMLFFHSALNVTELAHARR